MVMKCSKCGAENASDAKFCYRCGQELDAAPATCPNCHAPVMPGAAFCSHCGQALAQASPMAAHPPSAGDTSPETPKPAALADGQTTAPAIPKPLISTAGQTSAPAGPAPAGPAPAGPAPAGPAAQVVQTVFGNRNIQLNLQNIHGSQIDIQVESPGEPQPLPVPVVVRPAAFDSLLDRQTELQDVAATLNLRAPVEISGEMGLGKTSLLRALGNAAFASVDRFPGGVVYHRAYGQPEPDLLQSLFSLFYQLPKNYKPSPGEIQRGLQTLQALVILDDIDLSRDQLADLRNQAPRCTFVLASTERLLWGEGRALPLGGLPAEESLALIERELGRALTAQERAAARQLAMALKGNPDRLLKTAARIQQGQSFESILQAMTQTPITPILLAGLPNPELRVLSVVALGKGAPIPLEHIAPLASLQDARPQLKVLQQQHLVQAYSPSYTLTGALAQELWRDWDLGPWAERAVSYFIQWAEAQSADPRRILPAADVILQLLEWAVSNKQWAQVLRLGRALQAALAIGLRWGAWLQVLKWILMAAQALGERTAEGWALHQIGTHAVCVGDRQAGQTILTQALQLRQATGDQGGVAVTQHNLNLLLGPLAPPSQGKPPGSRQPPSTPASAAGALKWILPLIAVTGVLAVAAILAIWRPWQGRGPAPTATRLIRPPVPTITTTGLPPPEILLELEGGCGQVYPPGRGAAFTYQPNQDGRVTLQLDGQDLPGSAGLEVQADTRYSGKLSIPRLEGQHMLSVIYDLGTIAITRECPFGVATVITPTLPPAPAVDLWLDPGGCGARYAPAELVAIHVLANQDGRVDFTIRPAVAASGEWFNIGEVSAVEVAAGQESKLEWRTPDSNGLWILRASLNNGQAEATCELQVAEKNPPVLQEIALVPKLPCDNQVIDAFIFTQDDSGIESIRLFTRTPRQKDFQEVLGVRLDDFSYQFTFTAFMEGGTQFYVDILDVNGNLTSTRDQPNGSFSGFVSSGFDNEPYCSAYLIWPKTDLPGMDFPVTPPVVESAYQCMQICARDLSCQSFTYDAGTKICWMKNGVPQRTPNEQCTSGKEFTIPGQ